MIMLSERASGRDNNLNLIRMIAASAVLVSHAYPIASGAGTPEPLKALTGETLGTLAVYTFFTISGFLIAASFMRASTLTRFLAARTLRLFPGLIVSLVLVAFVMGPLVTTLAPAAYLTHPETWTFILRNTALALPQYNLPGVFENNPYPTVEGSIWTLIHEVLCYMGLFVAGVMGLLKRRTAMTIVIAGFVAIWMLVPALSVDLHPKIDDLRRLALPFALGTAFYLWQHKIRLSVFGVIGLAALAWVLGDTAFYTPALVTALGYAVFWVAYVPGGAIRQYNLVGDYSYGIYIYAFPLQGLAVWWAGPMTPLENMLWSFPMTLICAIASWHLVENPALKLLSRHRHQLQKT